MSNIPPALTEFVCAEDDNLPPYPQTVQVMSQLSRAPGERFEAQLSIDRGDVGHWPLELYAPHKLYVQLKPPFRNEVEKSSLEVSWST